MFYIQMCSTIAMLQGDISLIGRDSINTKGKFFSTSFIAWNVLFLIGSFLYFNRIADWNLINISDSIYNIVLIALMVVSTFLFLNITANAIKVEIKHLRDLRKFYKSHYNWSIVSLPVTYIVSLLFGFALSLSVGFDMILTIVTMGFSVQIPLIIVEIFFYIPFSKKWKEVIKATYRKQGDLVGDLIEKKYKFHAKASIVPIIIEIAMVAFIAVFFIIPLVKNVDISEIKGSLPQNLFGEGSIIALITQVLGLITAIVGKNIKKKEKKNN